MRLRRVAARNGGWQKHHGRDSQSRIDTIVLCSSKMNGPAETAIFGVGIVARRNGVLSQSCAVSAEIMVNEVE